MKGIILLLVLIQSVHLLAQDTVTYLVNPVKTRATGKRHQSFFFDFEVAKGPEMGRRLTSQEIFWDFGGRAVQTKLYPGYLHDVCDDRDNPQQVWVKGIWRPENPEEFYLVWVAPAKGKNRMEKLESLVNEWSSKEGNETWPDVLLYEYDGKLLLSAKELYVQFPSGHWFLAEFVEEK